MKGIGNKRWEALNKAGFFTPIDLLTLFPYAYYDKSYKVDLDNIPFGEKAIFKGIFLTRPLPITLRRGLTLIKCKIAYEDKNINVVWFNQTYVVSAFKPGDSKIFYGKVVKKGNSYEINNPQILTERDVPIMPVYKLPKGIGQSLFIDNVRLILNQLKIESYIDEETAKAHNILPLKQAFNSVHFPCMLNEAKTACRSVSLEKLSYTLGMYKASKSQGIIKRQFEYDSKLDKVNEAINELPYKLTNDQEKAVYQIINGLMGDEQLSVLLEGDVGSGKTIVAFLVMLFAINSGYQVAIMAPTEILARQHYVNAMKFFLPHDFKVGILTGSMKKKERESTLNLIKSGEINVVVGTHAVIGDEVEFKKLALTIVDEQHRFGVCQRAALENKGGGVDKIVMSATPIPRTLALSLYGELKTIKLLEKPFKTNNIKTLFVPESKLEDMYSYIISMAKRGEKSYLVCPRIDSEEDISATGLFNELKNGALKGEKIGLVHGKMKEKDKDKVISDFRDGNIMILVSTTVIEVGVDIPNAGIIAIYGADKFGLSQLHQLRGRVGRNGNDAYCFLIANEQNERLQVLKNESDGFKLAEADFDMRGAGDFLGTRQHGEIETYLGIKIDAKMIQEAVEVSNILLKSEEFISHTKEENDTMEFVKNITLS